VDSGHVHAVESGDRTGDAGADIAAVRAVAVVAEPSHQLHPGVRGAVHGPARSAERGREGVAGQGRRDDVKRLACRRIYQQREETEELGDRAREPVGEKQRLRIRPVGAHVDEVDPLAVDLRDELREPVQPLLLCPPVVLRSPVVGELAQVLERDPALPADALQLGGPPGAGKPVPKVVEVGLWDVDAEGADAIVHRSLLVNAVGTSVTATLGAIAERFVPS
jgi:hypothetical protein